jgi:hypothetical protein
MIDAASVMLAKPAVEALFKALQPKLEQVINFVAKEQRAFVMRSLDGSGPT